MGLLDGQLDPQSASVLALAGGLLSPGSFGQGLSRGIAGQQQVQMNAQDMDAKRQALEMTKLQYAAALRNQNLINDYLSQGIGGGAAPPSSPSIMAGAPGTTPTSSPTSPMNPGMSAAPSAPSGPFGGLPRDQWVPDLAFNGGKNIGEMAQKFNTPVSFRPGGYAMSQSGQLTQFPQVAEGSTAFRDANGQWHNTLVDGSAGAIAAASTAKASGPAGYKQTKIIGPGGVEYTVFNKDLPGFGGAASLSPSLPTGLPPTGTRIDPAVQAQRDAEGAQVVASAQEGGPAPASIASGGANDIAALQSGIAREQALATSDPRNAQKHAANVQVLTQQLAQKQGGMPAGAIQTGLAPGVATGANNAQDTMNSSYKAVSGENHSAQTVQARLDQIAQFSKGAILGGDTGWRDQVNNLLSIANVSDRATDRKTAGDLLDKNASQIALALGTGSQGTDALRSLAAAANPSRHMTQPAINEAVAQLQASAQGQQAKAALLTPLYNAGNTAAYNTAEQTFDKNNDFRVFQIAKETQGMNKQQAMAYFQGKGYTPTQVATLLAQKQALINLGVKF